MVRKWVLELAGTAKGGLAPVPECRCGNESYISSFWNYMRLECCLNFCGRHIPGQRAQTALAPITHLMEITTTDILVPLRESLGGNFRCLTLPVKKSEKVGDRTIAATHVTADELLSLERRADCGVRRGAPVVGIGWNPTSAQRREVHLRTREGWRGGLELTSTIDLAA